MLREALTQKKKILQMHDKTNSRHGARLFVTGVQRGLDYLFRGATHENFFAPPTAAFSVAAHAALRLSESSGVRPESCDRLLSAGAANKHVLWRERRVTNCVTGVTGGDSNLYLFGGVTLGVRLSVMS